MKFRKVREGSIELYVPDTDIPEHGRKYGFYNPEMSLDRDISVAVLSVFKKMFSEKSKNEIEICDPLCATGVRGLRYKKEVGGDVTLNDKNERAIELARKNAKLNKLSVSIKNESAALLLAEKTFDVIDVDPFGSPCLFIDSAARSLSKFSFLCVTATDTATLFGVYPNACERKYGVRPFRCQFSKELGTRILAGFVIKELAKYGKCFTPVLCYARRHYIRTFGTVENSVEKTNEILTEFDFLSCDDGLWKKGIVDEHKIGKIYLGKLHDKDFCGKVLEEIKKRNLDGAKIVNTVTGETDDLFYYDMHWVAKKYKKRLAKADNIVLKLREKGFRASRTVFCDNGIKTNAGIEELVNALGSCSESAA